VTSSRPTVEVCLTPELVEHYPIRQQTVVVIDLIRASTSICAALHAGALEVRPVADLQACLALKQEGFVVAAERDGLKIPEANFGNSPIELFHAPLAGKRVALSTTNGTVAIQKAAEAPEVLIGAFANRDLLLQALVQVPRDVLLLCAGWKRNVNYDDTLFAGALVKGLAKTHASRGDTALLAEQTFAYASRHILEVVRRVQSRHRVRALGLERDVKYCLRANTHPVLPVYTNGSILLTQ